jgi:hypothetical protein
MGFDGTQPTFPETIVRNAKWADLEALGVQPVQVVLHI